MSYFRTCPRCGAHLDPGEECDCGHEGLPEIEEAAIHRPAHSSAPQEETPHLDEYDARRWKAWYES